MNESLALFRTIITYPWFANSSIILFMNKKDLLEEKIMTSHIADYFDDFDGEWSTFNVGMLNRDFDSDFKVPSKTTLLPRSTSWRSFWRRIPIQTRLVTRILQPPLVSRALIPPATSSYKNFLSDTENIKLVFCAVKDTIMQNALKEFNLA